MMENKIELTDQELNKCEEAITFLAEALGESEKSIIEILEDGMKFNSPLGKLKPKFKYCIDEMKATFDAY